MNLVKSFLIVVSVIAISNYSKSQNIWQQTSGPMGGSISSMTIDSSGNFYTGAYYSGVYKSTDEGQNWFSLNAVTDKYVWDIASTRTGVLFVATNGSGIYRSTNNGNSWQRVLAATAGVESIIILPNDYIFAGGPGFGIYRSTNNGDNWDLVSSGIPTGGIIQLNYDDDYNIYAAVDFWNTCLFRSTNFGANWEGIGPNVPAAVAVAVMNNEIIFCSTVAGLYKSNNAGQIWNLAINGLPGTVFNFLFKNDTIFGSTVSGVYASTNEGESWQPRGLSNSSPGKLYRYGSDKIYVTSSTNGILRTSDNGLNWEHFNKGIVATTIYDIEINNQNKIFVAADGIYTSSDFGSTWQNKNSEIEDLNISRIHQSDQTLYASADMNGIYRSTNEGLNWSLVFPSASYTWGITSDQNNNLYIADFQSGIFYSTNNGSNWITIRGDINSSPAYCISAKSNGVIFVGKTNGVYKTTNSGVHWIEPSLDFGTVNNITFDESGNIYAASIGGGVRKSTDDGNSWTLLNSGMTTTSVVYDLAFDTEENLFASTNKGIFKSTNFGMNWTQFGNELDSTRSDAITITQNNILFAGTIGKGVYRTINPTKIKLNSSLLPMEYTLHQNYPNPFNPTTIINYELRMTNYVQIKIYSSIGKQVATLVNDRQNAGSYVIEFKGENYPSGIYFYTLLIDGNVVDTKSMTLLK